MHVRSMYLHYNPNTLQPTTEVKKLHKATKMAVDEVSGGMEDDVPLGPGTTLGGQYQTQI